MYEKIYYYTAIYFAAAWFAILLDISCLATAGVMLMMMRDRQRQRDQYRLQKAHLFNMIADLAVDMLSLKEGKGHVSEERDETDPDNEDEDAPLADKPSVEPVEEVNAVKESDVTTEIAEDSPAE